MSGSSAPSVAGRLRSSVLAASLMAALAVGGGPSVSAAVETGYTVTDLGLLPRGSWSDATAINGWGQIVGLVFADSANHAVVWEDGTISDLGMLPGGRWSAAYGINDDGLIVGLGDRDGPPGTVRAILWDGSSAGDLGTLGGDSSEAWAINNAGAVVGSAWLSGNYGPHAFQWIDGTMTDLGHLGGNISRAYGINDAGTSVGWSYLANGSTPHAVRWTNGAIQDLGALPGFPNSEARGINNRGQIVGHVNTPPCHRCAYSSRAVLWDGGTIRDLGTLGGQSGVAEAINDAGQVIGQAQDAQGYNRAFVWENGTMRDLGTLVPRDSGWTFVYSPAAISDDGRIVGSAISNGVWGSPYVLDPNTPPTLMPAPMVTHRSALSGSVKARAPSRNLARVRQQPVKHARQPVHVPARGRP